MDKVRIDKWLWAARFFKTRSLAKTALEGGKIHCRGERCKPARDLRVGDELQIRCGYDVLVEALSDVRRGAPEAQQLYRETEDSIRKREEEAQLRKAGVLGIQTDGRPSKKQRRQLDQWREGF